MQNFKDESFISQYLSPKLMRDFKFFSILDDDRKNHIEVSAIHNESGYREIREKLASQYNLSKLEPNIQVWNVEVKGDRSITLLYKPHDRIPLAKGYMEVLKHLHRLWDLMLFWKKRQRQEEKPASVLVRHGMTTSPANKKIKVSLAADFYFLTSIWFSSGINCFNSPSHTFPAWKYITNIKHKHKHKHKS